MHFGSMGFLQVIMFKTSNQLFTGHIDSRTAVSDCEQAFMTLIARPLHLSFPALGHLCRVATIYRLTFCLMDSIHSLLVLWQTIAGVH